MTTITKWIRFLVAVAAFAVPLPLWAQAGATRAEPGIVEKQPAGSPEMGVLIIIGVVGFFVLVAWVFSRVGDDTSSPGDRTLI